MKPRRRRRRTAPADRVRHLIALDARNVVGHLERRLSEMVSLFSRLRDRGPLLTAVDSLFPSASFGDLALLDRAEQRAVNDFHEVLAELRWYLTYTEDMPLQIQRQVEALFGRLKESHGALTAVIGAAGEGPAFVDGEVVGRRTASPPLPARRGRR